MYNCIIFIFETLLKYILHAQKKLLKLMYYNILTTLHINVYIIDNIFDILLYYYFTFNVNTHKIV